VISRLLFHCQHSLGLGHLVRSLALAGGLATRFEVTLLNGGRLPAGTVVSGGVELVDLPPLGHDAQHRLVSHSPGRSVESVQRARARLVLETFHRVAPDVIVVELYPFGRRRFEFEVRPLLDAAAGAPSRPLVLTSVRDILVRRDDDGRHDERAALLANEHLDGVLVHSDPSFARFEESFRPTTPLEVPVHHTGFVVPPRSPSPCRPQRRLLVSAGGGTVGAGLLAAAADAAPALHARTGLTTTLVAGPFLPDAPRRRLRSRCGPVVELVDRVDDLCGEVAASAASLSQAGYNTTLDIVRAGRPAVVVPFADSGEDEQTRRAARMAELGVVRAVSAADLTPARLVDEVVAALATPRPAVALDLGGRARSTEIVAELAAARRRATRSVSPHTSSTTYAVTQS
jgi:predicted glycosyltransferase